MPASTFAGSGITGAGAPAGGGGGIGGPGGFAFGGRMRNEQIRGQLSTTIADSALDAAPYSLTGAPTDKPSYFQQRYTMTLGGPLKFPGLYKGDGRTTFFLNYNGNHTATPVDVFSTVPTLAARGGDFSASDVALIDPATGQPFAGNVLPASRIDPTARDLLQFIPLPNQDGDVKNFRYTTTTDVNTDDVNLRVIHSFSDPSAAGRAGGGQRGGGARGGGRGGTNLSIGIHYRRADSDRTTGFPTVAGTSTGSAWDVPVGLSFAHASYFHSIRLQFNRSQTDVRNLYSGTTDVAGAAGIQGVSADAFDWGLPTLSFTTISSLRDVTPSNRTDRTVGLSYSVTTTRHQHTLRAGTDVRLLDTNSRLDTNANGSDVFTGLYTAPANATGRTTGLDVADFLLGLPQEATLQYGPGTEHYRQNSWDLYFQDDWRVKSTLTVSLGVRYEYFTPYSETDNRLVTLDTNEDFTAAAPVEAGGIGPFTGQFPETLVSADHNNIAPRLGVAWKPAEKWTVRAGYGVNYVTGAYLPIAQQLAAQPPFSTAATAFGTTAAPIAIATAFAAPPQTDTQNTYGIDPDFRLGFVHIWNVDVQRDVTRTVIVGATYTGTRGGDLDIQRAPNRGPDGLTIPDVPPFIWESSPGHSLMNAFSVRVRKRQTHGFAGGASYTLSKSMDNASTIGGGTAIVAQNDKDLDAEWGLSSFDQRHRFNANASYELPFGTTGKWLTHGTPAAIAGGWMWSFDMQLASGTPFTARVLGDVADVGQGTNGSLRADTTGAPVTLDDKTVAAFFNTGAFIVPPAGQFGDAARNTITGPGITVANMALTRNITFAGTRGLSVRVQANNVFNSVQFLSIDTVVNSPTFGQVVSTRPMRTVQIVARLRF